jgi:hypothetical protein
MEEYRVFPALGLCPDWVLELPPAIGCWLFRSADTVAGGAIESDPPLLWALPAIPKPVGPLGAALELSLFVPATLRFAAMVRGRDPC